MKPIATFLTVLVCLLLISAAAADLHCTAIRPSSASVVLVCSASRLEAHR